jgi:hypothetical protein
LFIRSENDRLCALCAECALKKGEQTAITENEALVWCHFGLDRAPIRRGARVASAQNCNDTLAGRGLLYLDVGPQM